MTLRKGLVVATHPEDNSVDMVMADDGARLVGVQILTANGSTRTGTVDLPAVPQKSDKWDVTQQTGQDMHAYVAQYGTTPVVVGFAFPQINQMLFDDPKLRIFRHQSDVTHVIDGDGNMELHHPSGAYIRVGETPDSVDLSSKNADSSFAKDRNTGSKVYLRVALAGNVVNLTMTPDGDVTLTMTQDLSVQVGRNASVEIDGNANIHVQGTTNVTSDGDATVKAPNITLDATSVHVTGTLTADVDVIAGGISLKHHVHPDPQGGVVGPPE